MAEKLVIIGAEQRGNFNCSMLSSVLAGEKAYEEMHTSDPQIFSHGEYVEHGDVVCDLVSPFTLGAAFKAPTEQPICGCTDLTHDDLRQIIKARALKSISAVMQDAGWKISCGCHICRPALNYYFIAEWSLEYRDDQQSRFVNERNHANIQKDGPYCVVPRMFGGITTPSERRAIAVAADKYDVPAVHVTSGQRIDLETTLWGSSTRQKVKLAASGCPRNCAEATCKDVGEICVESGMAEGGRILLDANRLVARAAA